MTDKDKMREAFEKWYMTNTFAHVDHLSVFYNDLNCYPTPIANHCWKAWQAAQSVPVVGEVVAYACPFHAGEAVVNGTPCMLVGERNVNDYAKERGFPLIVKPTHSITSAELERLRKCELLLREARDDVADQLIYMIGALAGYPENDNRIQKQREFLAVIDAVQEQAR